MCNANSAKPRDQHIRMDKYFYKGRANQPCHMQLVTGKPMKISVALCTWNGTAFLRQQIDSILSQTRVPDEIVIRDDVSSDGTPELAHTLLDGVPIKVDIAIQPRNLGSSANFQDAILSCTGDVVFLADQDDFWLPTKVERMAAALETNPSAGWAFSDLDLTDENLRPIHRTMWLDIGFDRKLRETYSVDPFEALLRRPLVTGAASLFRREALHLAIPFPSDWVHDHWLSLFLAGMGIKGVAIDTPLVRYRTHPKQQIGTKNNSFGAKLRKIMSAGPDDYAFHARRHVELANRLRESGAPQDSVHLAERVAQHHALRGQMAGTSLAKRLRSILGEMRGGGYRFSAQPRYSWIKDLIGYKPTK